MSFKKLVLPFAFFLVLSFVWNKLRTMSIKRILRERELQNTSWEIEDDTYMRLRSKEAGVTILLNDYPFRAPRLDWRSGKRPLMSFKNHWHWLTVRARREENRKFAPHVHVCLCCQAPTCDWKVNMRIDDVVGYAMCVKDANVEFGEAPCLFSQLSNDEMEAIVKFL